MAFAADILKMIENIEVRLTHEQILIVMKEWGNLTQSQKDAMGDYFKRVPYSHPRWWQDSPVKAIKSSTLTPEEQAKANEKLKGIIRHFKGMDTNFNPSDEIQKEGD